MWRRRITLSLILVGLLVTALGMRWTPRVAAAVRPPVIVVMLENQEDVKLTQANAPYLMSLKTNGRYFSKYYGVVHPSFPNYLAAVAGDTLGSTGGDAAAGRFPGNNIWSQLTDAGVTWGVYQEHMPSICYAKKSKVATTPTKDKYAIGHNPAVVFENIFTSPQCQNVKPLTAMGASLPALSFVTPSYCNDMHGVKDPSYPANCQTGTQAIITRGDSWLRDHVDQWLDWGAIVIVTFDEGTTKAGVGGHIYTVEVGAGIPRSVDAATYNHYDLLAGLEDRFGVSRLRNAAGEIPLPIG